MAKARKMTKEELFDIFVGNIAGHCAELRVATGRFRATAVEGMSMVELRIVPKTEGEIDVWDMCYHVQADGEECLGNRCAAVSRYSSIAAAALRTFMESPE